MTQRGEPAEGPTEPPHVEYLTDDDLVALVEAELGSRRMIRDAGMLASAINRPRATLLGEPAYAGLAGKAAALFHSLAANHALVDGNKRVALAATLLFYALNDVRLAASDDELFELTMRIADGGLHDVEAIAERLRRWETPLEGPSVSL